MKRIPATLLWASSLLLLLPAASCTDTLGGDPDTDARAITFMPAAETRAAVENDFPDGSSFSVWGWYDTDKNVFKGNTVSNTSGAWTYDGGTQYWIKGKTYNFYGVYPVYPQTSSDKGTTATVDATGKITVTNFDCSKTGEEAVDLMTAMATGLSGNAAPVVAMEFKHTLTRITFSAKLADGLDAGYSLQVKEVALWASKQGDMTQDMSQSDSNPIWTTEPYLTEGDDPTVNDNYKAYLYQLTTDNGALKNETINIEETVQLNAEKKGDLLVIPQKMNETRPVLAIRYRLGYNDNYTEPMWRVCYLKDTTTDWTPGISLNYTFTIDENNVYFGIQINDWVTGNGEDQNINFE